MHIAIGPLLGRDVVEVIRRLQLRPDMGQLRIIRRQHLLLEPVDLGDRLLLHHVAHPGRQVTLRIRPGGEEMAVVDGRAPDSVPTISRRRRPLEPGLAHRHRQPLPELEDPGLLRDWCSPIDS